MSRNNKFRYVDIWKPKCWDHSGHELSQWETTLHCNVVSHWLSSYSEWAMKSMHPQYIPWNVHAAETLCVLLWLVTRFDPYPAGLLHWGQSHPVTVKHPWRIWANRLHVTNKSWWYNHHKTKRSKTVCLFHEKILFMWRHRHMYV